MASTSACRDCSTWGSATTRTARSPLTLVVSWIEQKAVAVLLSLLHLGIKGVTIGPNPPAFVTPSLFRLLQDRFDLRLTGHSAQADLELALA